MSNILNYVSNINLESQIIWQYANAEKMNALLLQKQAWYQKHQEQFWSDWVKDVLDISTANDYGLSVWGILLQVPRTYKVNGEMITLATEQYRLLLRGRLLYLRMGASVSEINQYLNLLFEEYGGAYVQDNLDMSINYILKFYPTEEQFVVLLNTNVLPRPAGVGYKIYVIPKDTVFGFYGSSMCGFNQQPFWNGINWARDKKVEVK